LADIVNPSQERVCAACGRPLGDGPVEQLTVPGTQLLRAYHIGCVPPTLDEQI
jgi:hypothetical protein